MAGGGIREDDATRRGSRARSRARPDAVVKLGGSLLTDRSRLDALLGAICESPLRVLVMPGGGPFANAVRDAHAQHEFSEPAAHDMAVLATHQTGLLIADFAPGLVAVENGDELAAAFDDGQQAVALAHGFLKDADDVPRTWEATSDTIAAWLAVELDAPLLIYVKSCNVPETSSIAALSKAGVLDPVCPGILSGAALDVKVFGAGGEERFAWLLDGESEPVGTREGDIA